MLELFLTSSFQLNVRPARWSTSDQFNVTEGGEKTSHNDCILAHCFPLFFIPDQQHIVFCFTAHINVLVPPICNTFQQWDLPHMDSACCGR